MNSCLPSVVLIFSLLLPANMGTLFAQSVPTAAPNNFLDAISSLRPGQAANLKIAPGTYRLPTDGLVLKDLTNVVIDGPGVTLLASNFHKEAISIVHCNNVTLRGMTLDYDPLPFTQGTITAIDLKARIVDFDVHAGYPDLTPEYLVQRINLFDKDAPRWTPGAPDYYPQNVERLDARKGRIHLGQKTLGDPFLKMGDRVVLNIRAASGVLIKDGSAGICLEDFTIYASSGLGVGVRFAEDGGTFKHLRIVPGPLPKGATEPRLFSTCADAMNIAYTRRGPTLENCEFAYQGDDSLNIHGVILPVLQWIDANTFLTMRPGKNEPFDKLLRSGDTVRFMSLPNYASLSEAKIAEVGKVDAPHQIWQAKARLIWPAFKVNELSLYKIRLCDPVKDVPVDSACEIPATAASGFTIKDSYFHDHRARGLRLSSSDGLIANNRFERIKGCAISLGPEFRNVGAAGWVHNVIVRDNDIRDVGQGADLRLPLSSTLGAISITADIAVDGSKITYFPGNVGIQITDNHIDGCSVDGINVRAAKDLHITANTLKNVDLIPTPGAGSDYQINSGNPITLTQADALIENNQLPGQ